MGEGRCKLHGGRSFHGFLHPCYKDGKYAKYEIVVTGERYAGKCVVVNDAKVAFDEEGRCLGIVRIGTGPELVPRGPCARREDLCGKISDQVGEVGRPQAVRAWPSAFADGFMSDELLLLLGCRLALSQGHQSHRCGQKGDAAGV